MGEELVMRQSVALVDAHEALDRPVHDVAVDPPLEHVGDAERERDDQELVPGGRVTCRAQYQIADRPSAAISATCAQPK